MTATLTPEIVSAIADDVQSCGINEQSLDALRSKHPNRRFTYCFEDDIVRGKPVLRRKGFAVYLVGGDEHCLSLTNDFERAVGVVIAEASHEEDA